MILILLAGLSGIRPIPSAPLPRERATLGGREWTLILEAEDKVLLQSLRLNTNIPWCFDGLQGRGVLKELALSLHWDEMNRPQISLAKSNVTTRPEDRGLIQCLDASIKAFPPVHSQGNDALSFTFLRSRKS